jgi:Rrf2 family protein
MFKIHRKIKYALISLKYIQARPHDDLTTAKEICVRFKIPFDPTSRVLQIMAQNGILDAEQGAHGGYRLAADLACISIYELSRLVVGPLAVADCCTDEQKCDRMTDCVLKAPMASLNARLIKVFKEISISEMI